MRFKKHCGPYTLCPIFLHVHSPRSITVLHQIWRDDSFMTPGTSQFQCYPKISHPCLATNVTVFITTNSWVWLLFLLTNLSSFFFVLFSLFFQAALQTETSHSCLLLKFCKKYFAKVKFSSFVESVGPNPDERGLSRIQKYHTFDLFTKYPFPASLQAQLTLWFY